MKGLSIGLIILGIVLLSAMVVLAPTLIGSISDLGDSGVTLFADTDEVLVYGWTEVFATDWLLVNDANMTEGGLMLSDDDYTSCESCDAGAVCSVAYEFNNTTPLNASLPLTQSKVKVCYKIGTGLNWYLNCANYTIPAQCIVGKNPLLFNVTFNMTANITDPVGVGEVLIECQNTTGGWYYMWYTTGGANSTNPTSVCDAGMQYYTQETTVDYARNGFATVIIALIVLGILLFFGGWIWTSR